MKTSPQRPPAAAVPAGPSAPQAARPARQSNMELLRLVAMLLVVAVHANYYSIGMPRPGDLAAAPAATFLRIFCEQAAIVCVNLFVLLSGWFGIRPTARGAANVLFQAVFFALAVRLAVGLAGGEVSFADFLLAFYPGSSTAHWFVASYLVLYLFAPLLNAFVAQAPRPRLGRFLLAFFAVQTLWGWLNDTAAFQSGYSPLSFFGLYLLARYVRLYPGRLAGWSGKACALAYAALVFLSAACGLLSLHALGALSDRYLLSYNSPFNVVAALFLLLAFSRLRLQSRWVNRAAASSFAIYLVHIDPLVSPTFRACFRQLYADYSGPAFLCLALLAVLLISAACLLLDAPRLWLWRRTLPLLSRLSARFSR